MLNCQKNGKTAVVSNKISALKKANDMAKYFLAKKKYSVNKKD